MPTIAETVMGGLIIAMGAAIIGKILGNKSVLDKIDLLSDKIDGLVPKDLCNTKHNSLAELFKSEISHLSEKIDRINNR